MSSQQSQQAAHLKGGSDRASHDSGNVSWRTGWYLFEDGKVVGPLQADDAFSRTEKTKSGQTRMVSRKGFTQWYPLSDFAELHSMAERYADHLVQARTSTAFPQRGYANLEPFAKNVGPQMHEATVKAPSVSSLAKIDAASQQIHSGQPLPVNEHLNRRDRKKFKQQSSKSQANVEREKDAKPHPQSKNQSSQSNYQAPKSFEDYYLLVASRLRLGRQRSPFLASCVYFPLTLGGYWSSWIFGASEELTWHLTGSSRVNFVLPKWMVLVPGVHFVFAWMVAKLMSEVEAQNGYRTISPVFSVLLAIFPPFFMLSIQGAMNRHWRLHVYHSMDQQQLRRS